MRTSPLDTIELAMPARPELLVLARLHAGTAGGLLDLNVDEIDDLRLAVEELCLWALDQRREEQGRLKIVISWRDDCIEASCTRLGEGSDPAESKGPSELSTLILDALVDEHGISQEDGSWTAWFRKSRTTT